MHASRGTSNEKSVDRHPRTALVTGASSGIGAAFARVFAQHGFDLVLTARRADRLDALATDLGARHPITVRTIALDLADPRAPERLEHRVLETGLHIDALVNNAGYGLPGTFLDIPWRQHADFIQVLLTSAAELCYRFMPAMMTRRYGRIVNVASLAGLLTGTAGQTLYPAAKAFVIRMSESLAREGAPAGVHVTALCPGFTRTEFHDVNGTREIMNRVLPRWMWRDADLVAREGYEAVMRGKPVYINGRVNRAIARLARYTPQGLWSAVVQSQVHRYRRT